MSKISRVEKVEIAGYFDDLITIISSYASCLRNVAKIIKLFVTLKFVIHPRKSQFRPTQKIEYRGFVIDSISMSVSLSNKKKKTILDICENALITSKVTIRYVARVLGKFFSSFLAVPLGRLHYRALERFKTEVLKEHERNFHKIVIIPKPDLDDILWWKPTIPLSFAPIVRENPSVTVNTDASSFGWGACTENGRTGGQFNLEERECHINILELKAPLH